MKRKFLYYLFVILSLTAMGQERPKVALVLSGGGAKGAAHVGALKVLEEAGIPIDMIVGTSMGSLVGGLYSYGYNAEQLDSILSNQDWMTLLTDKKKRREVTLADRQQADKYAMNVHFEKSPAEVIEGGILKGNNISRLLCELTADRLEPFDFRELPIPFACVATDLTTNSEIDFTSGILAESMRCSMSIPGVFAPVCKDSMVLVDGGLMNNYPVDLARQMGADIVIGVDVTAPLQMEQAIKTTPEILNRVLDLACKNKFEDNVVQTDIYIQVNVQGYSSSSFKTDAIDSLICRGEYAARQVLPQLRSLRQQIGLGENPVVPKPARVLPSTKHIPALPSIYNPLEKKNWMGVGLRFDDEEYAAIMIGARYFFKHHIQPSAYAEIRLGERLWGKIGANIQLSRKWWMDGGYQITYAKSKLYEDGYLNNDVDYIRHRLWLQFSKMWHNINFSMGGQFNQIAYKDLVTHIEDHDHGRRNEHNLRYYISAVYDDMDARAFPTKGVQWSLMYEYLTDNASTYKSNMGLHQAMGKIRLAIPLTSYATLLPVLAARFIPCDNAQHFNMNYIGGIDFDGRYLEQQISFAGVKYAQRAENFFAMTGATFRQNLTKNHFAFGVFNYGFGTDGFGRKYRSRNYFGTALGYGYKTPIGPVEAHFSYSNESRFGFNIQLGYKF